MKHLLILWHSRTGTAQALATAAHEAACAAADDVRVDLCKAEDASSALLLGADGYIFACPENLGSMSGMMKEMVDRLYYPLLDHIAGRPYALIIAAGTDGAGAARQWSRVATGWRLRAVADPLIVRTGADTPSAILAEKQPAPHELARAAELGARLAAGLSIGAF